MLRVAVYFHALLECKFTSTQTNKLIPLMQSPFSNIFTALKLFYESWKLKVNRKEIFLITDRRFKENWVRKYVTKHQSSVWRRQVLTDCDVFYPHSFIALNIYLVVVLFVFVCICAVLNVNYLRKLHKVYCY